MKLSHIFKNIDEAGKSFDEISERRDLLRKIGTRVAAAAVPFIAVTSSKKAQAKTTDIVSESIAFVLGIDYLAANLYSTVLSGSLIPAGDLEAIKKIAAAKNSHIAQWATHLTSMGAAIPSPATYDLTAKGAIPKVLTEYKSFLATAQAIEDMSVRMYNKAMVDMITANYLRGHVTTMHSANARFAAHIRLLGRNNGIEIMPWIQGNKSGSVIGTISRVYQGEDNIMSLKNINAVNINGFDLPFEKATEAFDEPIANSEALLFINSFIV